MYINSVYITDVFDESMMNLVNMTRSIFCIVLQGSLKILLNNNSNINTYKM